MLKVISVIFMILGALLIIGAVVIFFLTDCFMVVKNLKTTKKVTLDTDLSDRHAGNIYYENQVGNISKQRISLAKKPAPAFMRDDGFIAQSDTAFLKMNDEEDLLSETLDREARKAYLNNKAQIDEDLKRAKEKALEELKMDGYFDPSDSTESLIPEQDLYNTQLLDESWQESCISNEGPLEGNTLLLDEYVFDERYTQGEATQLLTQQEVSIIDGPSNKAGTENTQLLDDEQLSGGQTQLLEDDAESKDTGPVTEILVEDFSC